MAKVKFNPIFRSIRNSVGDLVLTEYDGAHFLRMKGENTSNTPDQEDQRNAMKQIGKDWKQLKGVIQEAWKKAAKERKKKRMNGYTTFMGDNLNLQREGKPLELCPESEIEPLKKLTAEPGAAPGEITVAFTPAPGAMHLTFFTQAIVEENLAGGKMLRHDAGANAASPFTLTGLEPGKDYFIYAILTDAAYADAKELSASVSAQSPAA